MILFNENKLERFRSSPVLHLKARRNLKGLLIGHLNLNIYLFIRQLLGSCQAVVRQSSGSRQAVVRQLYGSHSTVVEQSLGSRWAVIEQSAVVVQQSSGNSKAVVLFSALVVRHTLNYKFVIYCAACET